MLCVRLASETEVFLSNLHESGAVRIGAIRGGRSAVWELYELDLNTFLMNHMDY